MKKFILVIGIAIAMFTGMALHTQHVEDINRSKAVATLESAGFVLEDNKVYTRGDAEVSVGDSVVVFTDDKHLGWIYLSTSSDEFNTWLSHLPI